MKDKKGSNGYIISIVIIILMFMSYAGINESTLRNAGYEGDISSAAFLSALLSIGLNILCVGLVPLITRLIDKRTYIKHLKLIYILNGIAWIFLSIPIYSLVSAEENSGLGIIGATVFSIVIYNFIRGKEKYDLNSKSFNSSKTTETAKFKCSECGAICSENDNYCKNCHAIFAEDNKPTKKDSSKKEVKFKCDNCGAMVPFDAIECPNCGELFEGELSDVEYKNVDDIYEKAEYLKNKNDIANAKQMYTKYISETEKVMKSNDKKCYTFGNCIEFVLAAKKKLTDGDCIDINYDTSEAYLNLAIFAFDEKDYDAAIKLLNKSLKLNPTSISSLFEMAENYKAKEELDKYYDWTEKCYDRLYHVSQLAHYYRNLGYYYIEKKEWNLAKSVYLYSLKYDNNPNVEKELKFIASKSKDESLPKKEELTSILRKNNIPTFISKENLNIIKELYEDLESKKQLNTNVGKFLSRIMKENSNT